MITKANIESIEKTVPEGRWYVHNGFLGWAYGTPLNPTPITRECALRLLNIMSQGRQHDVVQKLTDFPYALDYAEEGDKLYEKTGGNRLIAFVSPETCVFERKIKGEQDFDL
ncbi:MAG: hypothetical protein JJU29_17295 [Verrucomicrobia bacterium]|nr:hypothetical protein [Verrucomicrobiota bacterium]MCH8513039.1 hypothetical protein [Kiritimatiellia bacterium]